MKGKDFAMIGVAALLMAGFYALGSSTPDDHSLKSPRAGIYSVNVTDTVPKHKDTMNRRMPTDTMSRKDTLHRRDSLQ